jgi:steroid 5-alpha reductase family enzyme
VAALEFFNIHGPLGLWILGLMSLLWVISLLLKNSSIVDIFWGTGFVIISWIAFVRTINTVGPRGWLIVILVTIWGLRLTLYVFWRNAGKGEDFRYAKWRKETGESWWWKSYFKVFLLQGFIMWVVAAPLTAIQVPGANDALGILDYVGSAVWGLGFFFETIGDSQLARFKRIRDNKGQLLRTGVWRYTRHPNYFGDSAQWWGFYLIALASGAWWTIVSPIWMTYLLVKVSGVAMLERTLEKTKPDYEDYVQKTNALIPWFPKKD